MSPLLFNLMARRNASPQQIIRKDGNNCFVEALNGAFDIGKLQLKFVTYDLSKAQGSKFTNEIDIYIDLSKALRICYDALDSGLLIKSIMREKAIAEQKTQQTGNKVWAKQLILHQGGTSAQALASSGKSRPDGMSVARVLKIFAGEKLPVMFKAEMGPGETDKKGLIIPKYGYKPESYVQIGMSADDFKEFFITIRAHIEGYIAVKNYERKYDEKLSRIEIFSDTILEIAKDLAMHYGTPTNIASIKQEHARRLADLKPKYGNSQNSGNHPSGNYGRGGYSSEHSNDRAGNFNGNSGGSYNVPPQSGVDFMNIPTGYDYPFV